jgi:5-methylcytosine-specific restriction endonuclease McrA
MGELAAVPISLRCELMRLCSGCQTKVPDNVRFCSECKPSAAPSDGIKQHAPSFQQSGSYDDALDGLRKSTRWQRLRAVIIRLFPFCNRCHAALSEIVDHIVPAAIAILQARESKRWPYDKDAGYFLQTNLQGLCRPCHGLKTIEDKAHAGPWPNVVEEFDKAPKKKWSF